MTMYTRRGIEVGQAAPSQFFLHMLARIIVVFYTQ